MVVFFFICIYVVGLNKRIYVSVTYVLCLYVCSWVILLTTCGCKTIVLPMEHTFGFDMKTITGFHQWYSTSRYNHRITFIELIYLRSAVVLVYGVYKYTTVDVNAPYRRFECIVVVIFVVIYVLFSTDFFICIYLYICPRYFIFVYIHISLTPIFICICVHILIHIFVFSRHYILTAHMFATTCQTAIHSKQMFDLIHSKFSIRLKTLDE
jgi:hypothetical protein